MNVFGELEKPFDFQLPRLNLVWFIPPPKLFLPTIAATVFGDDEEGTLREALVAWAHSWERHINVEQRSDEARTKHLVQNGTGHLFIVLGNQEGAALADLKLLMKTAPEIGFPRLLVAILGRDLLAETERLAASCSMLLMAAEPSSLLHPLRLLLSPHRLIGYDNQDVFDVAADRIGTVSRVADLSPKAARSLFTVSGRSPSGIMLLIQSSQAG